MAINVYAENSIIEKGMTAKSKSSIQFLLLLSLLLFGLGGVGITAPRQDLQDRINTLNQSVDTLKTDQPAAFARLHAQINALQATLTQLNLSGSVLMAGSTLSVPRGTSFNYNISILPGTGQPAIVQGTIIVPDGWTLNSVTLGPSSISAGKTIGVNINNGIFIIYGFNQTTIPAGVVAIANFTIPQSVSVRLQPISIINPVAADLSATPISISEISGTVSIGA